jgi:hypothetical protein
MYQTQLLKIRIRPGKTDQVVDFLRTLMDRKDESIEALRREGMVVESLFLERRDEADYLYYYVKAKDLAEATQVNLRATDPLTLEIRKFVSDTWGDVSSPEPLLDIDLIPADALEAVPEAAGAPGTESSAKPRPRRPAKAGKAAKASKSKTPPAGAQGLVPPHALAGG